MQLTRRSALALGVGAVALAACRDDHHSPHASSRAVTPAPDAAALETARADEVDLLAAYDRLIAHAPAHRRAPLQVERAIHATHLAALHGVEAPTTSADRDVERALRESARRLRRLALHATAGADAALLASIAASHTTSAT